MNDRTKRNSQNAGVGPRECVLAAKIKVTERRGASKRKRQNEGVRPTGRQLRPLSTVLYRIISKRRYILAAQLLLREKSGT